MQTEPPASTSTVGIRPPDDATLIAASLRDPERFGELYERHHVAVFRYVRSRLGQHADDVVGDTFIEAFRRRERFDPARSPSGLPWLLGIASTMVDRRRDAERRWIRACAATTDVGVDDVDHADADSRIDDARLAPWMALGLANLRRRDRTALLLHVAGGLSVEEVAIALEVPPGTVKSRLHRARRILAAHLEVHR